MGIVEVNDIPIRSECLQSGRTHRLSVDAQQMLPTQMLGCFIPMHTCIDNCIHTQSTA